jgi:hypothetical protein
VLGLEAYASVELDFEPLAGVPFDPLAVDSLVLLVRPGIPKSLQFKALTLQPLDVHPDAPRVVSRLILKGVTDRIRYTRNSFLRRAPEQVYGVMNLLFDAVAAFPSVVEADQVTVWISGLLT